MEQCQKNIVCSFCVCLDTWNDDKYNKKMFNKSDKFKNSSDVRS